MKSKIPILVFQETFQKHLSLKMSPFRIKLHAIIWLVPILLRATVLSMSSSDYGRQMVIRAHQGICWYEYLKMLPETKSHEFLNCYIQAPNVLKQIKEQGLDNKYFGEWMSKLAMVNLPNHYHDCNAFLMDPLMPSTSNYSGVVLESTTKEYPFRGFVHCLIDELQKTHHEKAIEDLKHKISKPDHWKIALLHRENEFRAIHSSEPLKLTKQLSTQAQLWADTIAKECNPHHSKGSDPDRQFQGGTTGESLAMASSDKVPASDSALLAANGWYEEIKDYPYPEGYTGDGSDELFPKIGHFTQTVWKESKYVGYGYAVNKECQGFKTYVVARYYPAGNMIGDFKENVMPPKEDSHYDSNNVEHAS